MTSRTHAGDGEAERAGASAGSPAGCGRSQRDQHVCRSGWSEQPPRLSDALAPSQIRGMIVGQPGTAVRLLLGKKA
eukprot:755646-Hanusia_phi.AAC.11